MQRYLRAYMNEIIQYIITFLLYGNSEATQQVGYTADEAEWQKYRVVIVPNGHLGSTIVMPDLEDLKIENWKAQEKTVSIIRTDIIYNTFFFVSRAEELINPQRDEHGRFLAQYSLLGANNRLMIPLIDEYSRFRYIEAFQEQSTYSSTIFLEHMLLLVSRDTLYHHDFVRQPTYVLHYFHYYSNLFQLFLLGCTFVHSI